MRPKGKLFALLAVFMAIGVVAATGAFTTVSADRTAEVSTAGDSSALLGIEKAKLPGTSTATENADEYVNAGNTISINFTNGTSGSTGVNLNATTRFDRVLNVTNQGSQSVNLSVTLSDDADDDETDTETPSEYVSVYANDGSGDTNIVSESNYTELVPGESVYINIKINTDGFYPSNAESKSDDILDGITFVANQDQSQ